MTDSIYDTLDPDQLRGIPPLAPQPEPVGLAPKIGITEDQPSLSEFGDKSFSHGPAPQTSQPPQAPSPKLSASDKYHAGLKAFGDQRAALTKSFADQHAVIDHLLPTNTKDPNYFQDLASYSAEKNRIKQNEIAFKQENPWGSAGNHPGFFGKLGHVLGMIGNVAGEALAPGIAEAIPGSKLNLERQAAEAQGGIDKAEGQYANLQKAEAAQTTAGAHQTEAGTHATTEPIKANAAQQEADVKQNALKSQIADMMLSGKTLADPEVKNLVDTLQAENKAGSDKIPPHINSLQHDGKVHIMERDPASGQYSIDRGIAPPTPTTQPQVPLIVPGSTPGSGKLQILHQGQEFNATNAINPSQLTATNKSVVAEQGSMNSIKSYQQDYQKNRSHLTPADIEALKVLTSHAKAGIATQLFQDAGTNVLDALVGQPLTGYTEKLMQSTMTADQYAQMSPHAQKMLFGYTHAIVANFVNMKQKLGSIGRNPDQIQSEMANIPVPYIDTNAANEAFTRTLRDAQATTFNPFGGGGDNTQPLSAAPTGGLEGRPSFAEWKKQQGAH